MLVLSLMLNFREDDIKFTCCHETDNLRSLFVAVSHGPEPARNCCIALWIQCSSRIFVEIGSLMDNIINFEIHTIPLGVWSVTAQV